MDVGTDRTVYETQVGPVRTGKGVEGRHPFHGPLLTGDHTPVTRVTKVYVT